MTIRTDRMSLEGVSNAPIKKLKLSYLNDQHRDGDGFQHFPGQGRSLYKSWT